MLQFGNVCERLSLRTGQKGSLKEKLEGAWNVIKAIIINTRGTLILLLFFKIAMRVGIAVWELTAQDAGALC